jgi:hypothetical protein
MNLNDLKLKGGYGLNRALADYSIASESNEIEVVFRDLEGELIKRIARADVVLGCVAWLTNENIIESLAYKRGVSIIVQKEDFLRPDQNSSGDWKVKLSSLYSRINNGMCRAAEGFEGTILREMSTSEVGWDIEPVRCVGNHNSEKNPAFPRMHNKFLIFCHDIKSSYAGKPFQDHNFVPYEVWTGSFNFSKNACNSFENAVIIRDKKILKAFLHEYAQIAALSEPLDWTSDWCAPEWRIGS